MNKKRVLVILLVIACIAGAIYFFMNKKAGPIGETQQEKPFSVEKKEIPPQELPQGFTQDLPMPAGAKITQNYEANTSDGRRQSTRVITSKQKAEILLKLYKDYYTKLGWADLSKKGESVLLFRNVNDTVVVSVSSSAGSQVVEITLTQAALKK